MLKNLRELTELFSSTIKTAHNVVKAGEYQSELLRDTSKHDVDKRRHQFKLEIAEWKQEVDKTETSEFQEIDD